MAVNYNCEIIIRVTVNRYILQIKIYHLKRSFLQLNSCDFAVKFTGTLVAS